MEDDDVRDYVICPVCLEIFTDPRCLPCGHTFCRTCLDKLQSSSSIDCPVCRHRVSLSVGGTNALPKNIGLASLAESLRMKNTCKTHCKIMVLFCDDCGEMVCKECLQTHVRHRIVDIDIAYRDEKGIMDALLDEAKSTESQVNEKVTNCGRVIRMLEKSKNDSEKAVRTYFDRLKEQIDSKKQYMIRQIQREFVSREVVYQDEQSAVSSFKATLRDVQREYSSISFSDKPAFLKKIRALNKRLDESLKKVRELPMDRSYEVSAAKCYPCNKNIRTFLDDVKIHRVGDSEHCHVCDNKEMLERKRYSEKYPLMSADKRKVTGDWRSLSGERRSRQLLDCIFSGERRSLSGERRSRERCSRKVRFIDDSSEEKTDNT